MDISNRNEIHGHLLTVLRGHYASVERLDDLVHLTMNSVDVLAYFRRMSIDMGIYEVEDQAHKRKIAERDIQLATREHDSGFPLLHVHAAMSLWAALEALIRTLFATVLTYDADVRNSETVSRIKVRVGEYEGLDGQDKHLYLLDLVEERLATKRKSGVERFEKLFEAFGMSSAVASDVTTCLLELYHIRNVAVHRYGVADRRIVVACPWLGLSCGDEVRVSHDQYHRYSTALSLYVFEVANRVNAHCGRPRRTHDASCWHGENEFRYRPTATTRESPLA